MKILALSKTCQNFMWSLFISTFGNLRRSSLLKNARMRYRFGSREKNLVLGRGGGGQIVSVLTFYSNNPSLNPARVYNFSVKFVVEKNENKWYDAEVGAFFKNMCLMKISKINWFKSMSPKLFSFIKLKLNLI